MELKLELWTAFEVKVVTQLSETTTRHLQLLCKLKAVDLNERTEEQMLTTRQMSHLCEHTTVTLTRRLLSRSSEMTELLKKTTE